MDQQLRDAEKQYQIIPTDKNLTRLNYIRQASGLDPLVSCPNCEKTRIAGPACDFCGDVYCLQCCEGPDGMVSLYPCERCYGKTPETFICRGCNDNDCAGCGRRFECSRCDSEICDVCKKSYCSNCMTSFIDDEGDIQDICHECHEEAIQAHRHNPVTYHRNADENFQQLNRYNPWRGEADVERHNKKCAKHAVCRKLWLKTANEYYERTGDDGGAVIRANTVAKKWLQKHGKSKRAKNPVQWWEYAPEEISEKKKPSKKKTPKKTTKQLTGTDIKTHRKAKQLSQHHAATLCGRTQPWISQIENQQEPLTPSQIASLKPLLGAKFKSKIKSKCSCGNLYEKKHGNQRSCSLECAKKGQKSNNCDYPGCREKRKKKSGRGTSFKYCSSHSVHRTKRKPRKNKKRLLRRRNPDEDIRAAERAFQTDPTDENWEVMNRLRRRGGLPPLPRCSICKDELMVPNKPCTATYMDYSDYAAGEELPCPHINIQVDYSCDLEPIHCFDCGWDSHIGCPNCLPGWRPRSSGLSGRP